MASRGWYGRSEDKFKTQSDRTAAVDVELLSSANRIGLDRRTKRNESLHCTALHDDDERAIESMRLRLDKEESCVQLADRSVPRIRQRLNSTRLDSTRASDSEDLATACRVDGKLEELADGPKIDTIHSIHFQSFTVMSISHTLYKPMVLAGLAGLNNGQIVTSTDLDRSDELRSFVCGLLPTSATGQSNYASKIENKQMLFAKPPIIKKRHRGRRAQSSAAEFVKKAASSRPGSSQ